MDLLSLGQLIGGLAVLTLGADVFVRGASRLAASVGVSPLVIGLTVVAYGTSAPELAVSIGAGLEGNAEIAVANVVGSNIFNVLFILGACAAIAPLVVSRQLIRLDVPLMIGASGLVWGLSRDGRIGVPDGVLLTSLIVLYTVWAIRKSRRETAAGKAQTAEALDVKAGAAARGGLARHVVLLVAGLGLLVLGADWFVDGSIALARALGLSDVVIGLTIVAAGTSMPEVATSIVATIRGERDIAIGNVVGSNLYNLLAILGISSLLTPGGLRVAPSLENFDVPIMLAVAAACLPVFFTGHRIARWEGFLFLGYYAAYATYLVLAATKHDALPAFSAAMWDFVLPITVVTLAVVVGRALRERRRARREGQGASSTPA